MYSIYCDSECIYNDEFIDDKYKLTGMSLELKDNSAGTLKFTMSKSNHGYDSLKRFSSVITVYRERNWLWSGRAIQEETNFNNDRVITCEGELNYLLDTIQPPSYGSYTVRGYLEKLISAHNSKCESYKQFTVGLVTVTDPNNKISRYTNYENTLKEMSDDLVDDLGGHFKIRHESSSGVDVRYLDYIEDDTLPTAMQTIEFGKNLSDFAKNYSANDIATVIIPRGARLETETIPGLDDYLTVASVNDGSIYVSAPQEVIDTYGRIEKVVDWDDITLPKNLLNKAQKYLLSEQWEDLIIKISAVDLHYLNSDIESINLLDRVRCRSAYHGMDTEMTCTEIKIELGNPNGITYTLSKKGTVNTLSASSSKANNDLNKKIDTRTQGSLSAAREEATAIMNMITAGYITIKYNENGSQELWIADTQDPDDATRYWRWNANGLMYTKDGGQTFTTGMNMQGQLIGDIVKTGKITDGVDKNYWNLDTGDFVTTKGTIGGWVINSNELSKTIQTFIYPDERDLQRIKNIMLGTTTPTTNDLAWYDYDGNGTINITDLNNCKQLAKRTTTPEAIRAKYSNKWTIPKFSVTTYIRSIDDASDSRSNSILVKTIAYGRTNYSEVGPYGLGGRLESKGIHDTSDDGLTLYGGSWYYNADTYEQTPQKFLELGRGHGKSGYHLSRDANAITEGDDLNNYFEIGQYWCSSGSITNSLENCPVFAAAGFKLIVQTLGGDNWWNGPNMPNKGDLHRQQIILANNGEIWTRIIAGYNGSSDAGYNYEYKYEWMCLRGHTTDKFTITTSGWTYSLARALRYNGSQVEVSIMSDYGVMKYLITMGSSATVISTIGGSWQGPSLTATISGGTKGTTLSVKASGNIGNVRAYIQPTIYHYSY